MSVNSSRLRAAPPFVPVALLPIIAVVFIAFLVIGLALPVLPLHVHQDLGLGTFVVGLVAGAQFAASLLSRFWAGNYADSRGGKRALVTGLLVAAAAGLPCTDGNVCLYRDADVVITGWSDGRIPWPRCRGVGVVGGSGLLVDDELARAVRSESALAVRHWWGASSAAVKNWRRALGVAMWGTEGSRRLHRAAPC